MAELLRVENLCKDQILNNVSFTIEKGEMVAVMGPSGSGKSTLLYNVAGMDQPSGGSVFLNGEEITKLSEDEKAFFRLHKMGFVFQQMNMMGNLNILDNILLPSVQANKAGKEIGKRNRKGNRRSETELLKDAENLMKKLSVSELAGRSITQVSGGQLQRACICRSTMNSPKLLFADEPTGALNRTSSNEVMDELVKLNKEGTTIVMVTHDAKVASRCSRVLFIVDGNIKGEYTELSNEADPNRRERGLNNWLMDQGW